LKNPVTSRNQAGGVIIEIGGLAVGLTGLEGSTLETVASRYALFLVEREADFQIELNVGMHAAHRPSGMPDVTRRGPRQFTVGYGALDATLDLAAGRGQADVPDSIWVIDSLLRITMGLMLAERGGLLLHASGVRLGAGALVCFGPSGVGKSTVARSVAPDEVFCDEMIALIPEGDQVRVWGTPFHGDYAVCAPLSAPLVALVRLVHGSRDEIEPLSPASAAQALLNSTLFFCADEALAETLLASAIRVCVGGMVRLTFQRGTHVPTFIGKRLGIEAVGPGAQAAGPRALE
jgi:hypothetical protein